jgi:hypothetical protein
MMLAGGFAAGLSTAAAGQQPPDFSGTWRATKAAPAGREAAPTPVFGEVFALRHRGQTLDLIRPVRGRDTALVHAVPLDGSEQRQMIPGRTCLADTGSVVKAAWDGQAIAYTLVSAIAPGGATGAAVNLRYTFRREGADRLIVETSMREAATGSPKPAATVYEKSSDVLSEPPATPAVASARATIADVSWIAGHWVGTSGATTFEERWTPASGGAMLAISRTMRSGAMSAFEFLCISERDSTLVYTAMPNAVPPTDFVLTRFDADSATFENPVHSFPKMIRYAKRPDGTMEAVISGTAAQKPTTFVFKRADEK